MTLNELRQNTRRMLAMRALASVMIAALSWGAWGGTLRSAFAPDCSGVPFINEDFTDGAVKGRAKGTFDKCPDGWCLKPHQTADFIYEVPLREGVRVNLRPWFYNQPGVRTRLEASIDGGFRYRRLSADQALVGTAVIAPTAGKQNLLLKFRGWNTTDKTLLVLDKLVVDPISVRRPLVALAVFCLGCIILPWSSSKMWMLAAIAIIAAGASLRAYELVLQCPVPLEPDAEGYREFAMQMRLFTTNGFYAGDWGQREPLFLLIVRGFFAVAGSDSVKLRLLSTLLSITVIAAVMWTVRRFIGSGIALGAGLATALSLPLRNEAARGLRLEAETVLLIAYFVLAFSWQRDRDPLVRAIVLGTFAGALALLRMTYLPALCALNAFELITHSVAPVQRRIIAAAVAVCISVALIVPHRYSLYRHHGDPFFDTSLYARWNANMEFAGRPGFPTRAALEVNAYQGPPISYREYMFGLHSIRQVIVHSILGYQDIFSHMDVSQNVSVNELLQVLALIGFVLALRDSGRRWVPIAFVLLIFPVSFLYHHQLVERYRHTLATFPLVLLAAGFTCEGVAAYAMRALGPRHHRVGR